LNPSTQQQVIDLIAQAAQIEVSSIHPHDHLLEDLKLDSLELAEVVALLHHTFSIRTAGICEPGCLTVSQVVQRVIQLIHRQAA